MSEVTVPTRARRELAGNRPLLLDDPTTAWVVEAGSVYVFAVHTGDAGPDGSRELVCEVGVGGALLGMPGRDGLVLLAVGRPGTSLVDAAEHGRVATSLVWSWERDLAGALGDVAPRDAVVLEAGEPCDTTDGVSYRTRVDEQWVRVEAGAMSLAGSPAATLGPDTGAVPLSASTWVRSSGTGRLVPVDPPVDDGGAVPLSALTTYHDVVWTALAERVRARIAARTARSRNRSATDVASLDQGLRELVGVFEGRPSARSRDSAAAPSADPLVAACRLVGDALGVLIEAPPTWQGDSRERLAAITRSSRVRERRVSLDGRWWRTASGPLLGYRAESQAPVALIPDRRRRAYHLVDPADGSRTAVTAEVAAGLSSEAHSFYRPFPDRPLGAMDLLRFGARRGGGDIATIVLMGVLGGLLALVPPLATDVLFNRFIPDRDINGVVQIAIALLASVAATTAFQVVRAIGVARLGARMDEQLEAAVWDRLLGLPVPFFRRYSSGDLALRATSISTMRRVLSAVVTTAVLGLVFAVFSYALLFYYDVRLALVATGVLAAALAVGVVAFVVQVRDRRRAFEVRGRQTGLVFEMLNGVAKLRVAGAESRAFSVWAHLVGGSTARRAQLAGVVVNVVYAALPLVALLLVFPVVVGSGSTLSAGSFVAFNTAFSQVIVAVVGLGSAFGGIAQIVPLFERVQPILEALPESDRARADPGELLGDIEVEDVTFRYDADAPPVLQNVSFRARPGEFVALVGPSGSGKSTILRLLLGFEKPESGSVYVDAQDLATIDLRAVRRQMGVVLQSGQLAPGTIFSNIVGTSPYTLDEAWEAARGAGLEPDIRRMPMGMHTVVLEGGAGLSGGQRQRLLIARAIVAKPRILLFDEATSALDNRTQAMVTESLDRLETTRIVIAHRLSTVIRADRIHVVEAGRIVESGRYEELMAQGGVFASLASRQLT